ncbi:MAG: gamma-glutamyltransferase, partial [Nitrospinota bacterium]
CVRLDEEELVGKTRASALARGMAPRRARPGRGRRSPARAEGSTTHLSAVDGRGDAVSLTQTLGSPFGSGVVVPGLGFIWNDHMLWMEADPASPNAPGPGKRTITNMSPTLVYEGERLRLVVGSPGSYRIVPALAQVLVNFLDHGMSLAEAVEAPRFHFQGEKLELEERIPEGVRRELAGRGFDLRVGGAFDHYFGGFHAVELDAESGALRAAADPRRTGTVAVL